jgi:hypothetical protein
MRLTPFGAAALIPSSLVGVACGVLMPFASGAPADTLTGHVPARSAVPAVRHARPPAHQAAQPTTPATAQPTPASTQPAPQPPAASQPAAGSQAESGSVAATSSEPLTAGMSPYEQCVAWRESGDNPTASSAGLFGILPSIWAQLGYPGTAGQASVALQKVAFDRLYAQYGTQPWSPSDGC